MAEYTIPEPQQRPLEKLRTIPDSALQALNSALEQSPFADPIIPGLSAGDASELKDAVLQLYRVRGFFDQEVPDFAAGIAAGLQEATGFPVAELAPFRDRLARVLTIKPLAIAVKAMSLKTEYERRFCNARILTDARPIYIDKPSIQPDAVMISHTLRITFHDDTGAMRETYITMDDDDLMTLQGLVNRAEEKAKSLLSVFAAANVQTVIP